MTNKYFIGMFVLYNIAKASVGFSQDHRHTQMCYNRLQREKYTTQYKMQQNKNLNPKTISQCNFSIIEILL